MRGKWLSDCHINAVQLLLREQHPYISGLQISLLGFKEMFDPMVSEGVQIIHHRQH